VHVEIRQNRVTTGCNRLAAIGGGTRLIPKLPLLFELSSYITLFHNSAIPDMFRSLTRRHNQGLYLALDIKSVCFVVDLNNILQRNICILSEDLGTTPDNGVVIRAETCRV
jgi:hypothetical protein